MSQPLTREQLKELIIQASESGFRSDWSKVELADVSSLTNMRELFQDIKNIPIDLDLSSWDVSNVTDTSYAFYASNFNNDSIKNWDVSNVTDMRRMFCKSKFNGDLSQWDVSNVINMSFMFGGSNFNGDISGWNVSNVEDMSYMFYASTFNNDSLKDWDVSNVLDMRSIFSNYPFDGDISRWNIDKVVKGREEIELRIHECVELNKERNAIQSSLSVQSSGLKL